MASKDFIIPSKFEAPAASLINDADETAQEALDILSENEVYCVSEPENYDTLVAVVGNFNHLSHATRLRLVDVLSSNLRLSTITIAQSRDRAATLSSEEHASYFNAVKIYTYFLYWIFISLEDDAAESRNHQPPKESSQGAKKGKRGKKEPSSSSIWDPEVVRGKLYPSVLAVVELEWSHLCSTTAAQERLGNMCVDLACRGLQAVEVMKQEEKRKLLMRILALCAIKHGRMDTVVESLMLGIRRHEHLADVISQLARFMEEGFGSTVMAQRLVAEFSRLTPADYDEEAQRTPAAVKHVAEMLTLLAKEMPRALVSQVSLLQPYLGCSSHAIRSAVVSVMGEVLLGALSGPANAAATDLASRGAVEGHWRSKEHLLALLLERAVDKHAYTRQRVLRTWDMLVGAHVVPLSWWMRVLQLAAERLKDSSINVVRTALQLVFSMLQHNPFAPELQSDKFVASLRVYEGKLEALKGSKGVSEGNAGPQWEQGDLVVVKEEEQDERARDKGELSSGRAVSNDDDDDDDDGDGDDDGDQLADGTDEGNPHPSLPFDHNVETMRTLIASLKVAVEFSQQVAQLLPQLRLLLGCPSADVVQETLALVTFCRKFRVQGAEEVLKCMWPLIFSREEAVRRAVVEAFQNLYLTSLDGSSQCSQLITITQGCTLGELAALQAIVHHLIQEGKLRPHIVPPLLGDVREGYCRLMASGKDQHGQQTREGEEVNDRDRLQGSFTLMAIFSSYSPPQESPSARNIWRLALVQDLNMIMKVGFCTSLADPWCQRQCAVVLQHLAEEMKVASAGGSDFLATSCSSVIKLLKYNPVDPATWCSVTEKLVSALFALHPHPHLVFSAILKQHMEQWEQRSQSHEEPSLQHLEHLCFIVGQVALQQLVQVEKTAKDIRQARLDRERRLDGAVAGATPGAAKGTEDINEGVGTGSIAQDAALDQLVEKITGEVMEGGNLIGRYGRFLSRLCHDPQLLQLPTSLQSVALLSLCKLMVVDVRFCEEHLPLIFTYLIKRKVDPPLRGNLMVALGDMISRFPNSLEPWTPQVYGPLADPEPGVRRTALLVLTHLILNDMMKVKGQISKMALLLVDQNKDISHVAKQFFFSLSKKSHRNSNPIYNLLPDMLSHLCLQEDLTREDFQEVMSFLLQFVKDKYADSLKEKLCVRFEHLHDPREWRAVAFCLSQLGVNEKGTRRILELLRCYKHSLEDEEVYRIFWELSRKSRKLTDKKSDFREKLDEYERELARLHGGDESELAQGEHADEQLQEEGAPDVEEMAIDDMDVDSTVGHHHDQEDYKQVARKSVEHGGIADVRGNDIKDVVSL